jgi:ABC-2 type transport system ATP-binding protein
MTEPYVVAERLGKSFDAKIVLEDVSFEVQPGDIVGVLGKNGAGKTTLLELMLGFTRPTAGSVRVFGHESFRLPGAAKARIGFVPQQDELLNPLTAADQIAMIASFYREWDRGLIDRLIERWNIDPRARVRRLSAGERQKLSILLALGHRPDLVVLDEPVASLDPVARRQFLEEIVDITHDGRRSVVFSSHIVSDIERLANKIWILKNGHLYWRGDFDALKESIVRVRLQGAAALPEALDIPNAFSVERIERSATAVVGHWGPAAEGELARRTGARVEVEHLTLEEIFLELHR